jgi:hypothetical protein
MAQTADNHHNETMVMLMLMLILARAMATAKAFMIAIGRWNKLLRLS